MNPVSKASGAPMPDTAVVLAGGLGTRLRSALPDLPKVLAPAAGRPFLDYLLGYLKDQGLRRVILSTGHLAEAVQTYAGDGERWGLELEYAPEERPLGTGGAMRWASRSLAGPFFGLNGDTLFMANLAEFWEHHLSAGARAAIALRAVEWTPSEAGARGCVRLSASGLVTAFDEKPTAPVSGAIHGALSNAGLYLFEPAALADLPLGQPASLEREVFPALARGGELAGLVQAGYFIDIGSPESLAAFADDLQSGRLAARS